MARLNLAALIVRDDRNEPRIEAYGAVAVFLDLEGNRWDLLGPTPQR